MVTKRQKHSSHYLSPSMLVLLGLVIVLFVGTQIAQAGSQPDQELKEKQSGYYEKEPAEYNINDEGLSMGTLKEVGPTDDLPDLIGAVATNGKSGYIYAYDFENAAPTPASPEEAVKFMEEKEALMGKAFIDALSRSLEIEITVDDETAGRAYTEATNSMLPDTPDEKVTALEQEQTQKGLLKSLNIKDLNLNRNEKTVDVISDALIEAQEATTVEIPVYLEDGKTKIGVFPVAL